MYLMKSKEWEHCVTRGIARTMIMSLLFGVIGGHAEVWTIEAQAKENADYNTLDGGGVVSLGAWHSAVIKADGSLWTWGWNNCGQLGNGTTENSSKPIEVLKGVKAVSLGSSDSAAIKIDGTAAVTVTGIGNYSGSYKGAAFQIRAWDYNTLTAEIEDQTYTGKALKPQVTFYMTGENGREEILLKPNTAVKITYKDNKNAGTATVTVSGKGELKNIAPFTVSFAIERADVSGAVVSRIPNQTLKGTAVKPIPKVKVGRNSLKANRDFMVSYIRNGVRGEATVIIRGVGNYTGECRKMFIVQ